jgi:hypothetical protein
MKNSFLTRALNTVRNLFRHGGASVDARPGQQTIAALKSEHRAMQQRNTPRPPGHRQKSRTAGKTRCRCFIRLLGSPFCKAHRHDVWCKKHRLYICLDCGRRDRSSGVAA